MIVWERLCGYFSSEPSKAQQLVLWYVLEDCLKAALLYVGADGTMHYCIRDKHDDDFKYDFHRSGAFEMFKVRADWSDL